MQIKKIKISAMIILSICLGFILPSQVFAAKKHPPKKVKIQKEDTVSTYNEVPYELWIEGQKKTMAYTPLFTVKGVYYGSLEDIFCISKLNAKADLESNPFTITYGNTTMEITDGNEYITKKQGINDDGGLDYKISGEPFSATYKNSKKEKLFVPIKSICYHLGLTFSVKDQKILIHRPDFTDQEVNEKKPDQKETRKRKERPSRNHPRRRRRRQEETGGDRGGRQGTVLCLPCLLPFSTAASLPFRKP